MDKKADFSLVLFATDPVFIKQAVAAGVDTIIVDWEYIGKEKRQGFYDTQINHDTVDDLRRVRNCTDAKVLCRINSFGATTATEIEQAIAAGVDELLLPMVRTVAEVQTVLEWVKGRCGTGIMMETISAVKLAHELGRLSLSRAYVGLNDLEIERKTPNIFTALADGTVDEIRQAFTIPFGFGGVTLPECGYPIPCRLLISELARLTCDFSFLRRSFYADTKGRDLMVEVPRMRAAVTTAFERSSTERRKEQAELYAIITSWQKYHS